MKKRDDSGRRVTPHSYCLTITHSFNNHYKGPASCPGSGAGDKKMSNAQALPSGSYSLAGRQTQTPGSVILTLRHKYTILWKQGSDFCLWRWVGEEHLPTMQKDYHSFICSQWVAPRSGLGNLQVRSSSSHVK